MERSNKLFIRQVFVTVIMIIIVVLSVMISIHRYLKQNDEMFYNNARIMVTDEYHRILTTYKENDDLVVEKEADYPYCIVDLSGKVVRVINCDYYKVGEQLNLNEILTYDNSFANQHDQITKVTFPIVIDKKTSSYVMFFLSLDKVWGSTKLERAFYVMKPFLLGVMIVLLYLLYHLFELKRKFINPVNEISESARAIIEGNYDREVRKLNKRRMQRDEVENLTYGFELMRDELKDRIVRETKLKQSQKELISCISHDLKTPISTIKAYSEGIRDGIANNPEKLKNYSDIIARKTAVLSQMISDLLDHSNAELNELTIYKEEVYFRLYMKRNMDEMEPYVRQHNIAFTYDLLAENLLVMMDERRISQVLYNLVENAMKYMDKDAGRIHVHTEYQPDKEQVCITIKDNGSGISMEDIPYVFNKFYRGEKSRNMIVPGCGLGLSICKYIVEQHGGEITCKSKKDMGTEISFTILCMPK